MLNVTRYFLILPLLLVLGINAKAQSCRFVLSGNIKDGQTMSTLPGATISLIGSTQKSIADARGHFHFNNLCAKTYEIEVSYVGYEKRRVSIDLNKNLELDILLHNNGNELNTVNVISKKSVEPVATLEKLEQRDLELSKGESLGEILKRLPGVSSIQTGPTISKPVIHGMHSNRILILNSGVRIEGQQWGAEHAPEIDPLSVKELTVVKGASGVQYGADALGGIVLAEPAPLNYHLPFSGELHTIGASNGRMGNVSALISGAIKDDRLAWRIHGSAKKAGNSSTPDYFLNNTGYKELNGALTLGYKNRGFEAEVLFSTFNTTLGIFEDAHIGNQDDLFARIALGRPFTDGDFTYSINSPRQEVSHHLLKVKGKKFLTNNSSLSAVYSFQRNNRQEFDIRRGDRSDVPSIDLSLNAQHLEMIYEQNKPRNIINKYGLSTSIIVNNNIPGTFVTPLIPNYDSFN
ncbi:TonB-dependent receptor, partial [Pseudoxanthomonas sp. SGD-10]